MSDSTPKSPHVSMSWSPYKRYVVGILLVVYTFNFIDRQIIAILSPAIKADLALNDTQLGFLKGFAFALFYASFGIPIARLADRRNRVTIIALALTIWSAMTALCGAAASFVQLAIARVGVGVGEAGCTPPAHSLIADYFIKEQRPAAIGLYSLGVPIGTVFGYLLGGWILETLGWRWAFVVVGCPGILIAIILKLTLKDPPRGQTDAVTAAPTDDTDQTTVWTTIKHLWSIKSFRYVNYAAGLSTFAGYALSMWIVDFLDRTHGLSISQITLQMALVLGVGGGIGTAFGGFIVARFSKNDNRAIFVFPAIVHVLAIPVFAYAIWASSGFLTFLALFPFYLLTTSVTGPYFGLVQNLAPAKMRAMASAFFLFILNAFGFGLGPLVIGGLSDFLTPSFGEAVALQWALTALIPVYLISSIFAFIGRRYVDADLSETR